MASLYSHWVPRGTMPIAPLNWHLLRSRAAKILFCKGLGDQRIYVNSSSNSTAWSGWAEIPGGDTTDVALAATATNDRLYLFRKGIEDKRIYKNSDR